MDHVELLTQIEAQYMFKNLRYNNAASLTYRRYGRTAYSLRLTDKMERFESLISNLGLEGGDESIDDTLRDAINYVFMFMGDLSAGCTTPEDTSNIDWTLKYIRKYAKYAPKTIEQKASTFAGWLKDNGYSLSEAIYRMGQNRIEEIPTYGMFACYLIKLYLDRRNNIS